MKFQLTFKTPDVLNQLSEIDFQLDLSPEYDSQVKECKKFVSEYLLYNEYITIEFDTEAKTATVLRVL